MIFENRCAIEPGKYQPNVDTRLKNLQEQNFVQRLWLGDENLWLQNHSSEKPSAILTGWLNATGKMLKELPTVEKFCRDISIAGFKHTVLLGMGGSSMAPLVFQNNFQHAHGIKLIVLDTIDPKTIKKVENEIDISKTLFIVSSKSGSTAEVMSLFAYFFDKVSQVKKGRAGDNFITITDEGSPLKELAQHKKFRKIFTNFPDIGGRYSALSYFGIVPAALMGINVKAFLERTLQMVNACSIQQPIYNNPGVALGATLAELALQGYNKLIYLMPPELETFGLWLEQLVAESTGKNGKGILPLNGAHIVNTNVHKQDCIFFQLDFNEKKNTNQNPELNSSISKGAPTLHITIENEMDLGMEFFRWEIATATAGAILQLNPFDQPNVQESKSCADKLLRVLEHEGKLPEVEPALIEEFLHYYIPSKENTIKNHCKSGKLLLENFFALAKPGDYIAFQAYLPEEPEVVNLFLEIQNDLQKIFHLPVTTQFGPRYLHSTGQYHKGGPNTAFFIHFISDSSDSLQIPGQAYTFGLLKNAQAIGDIQALNDHDKNVILIDLGKKYLKGLNLFANVVKEITPVKKAIRKPVYYSNDINVVAAFQ